MGDIVIGCATINRALEGRAASKSQKYNAAKGRNFELAISPPV
jgi:hypothetical protein